jgi:hypothetical protein
VQLRDLLLDDPGERILTRRQAARRRPGPQRLAEVLLVVEPDDGTVADEVSLRIVQRTRWRASPFAMGTSCQPGNRARGGRLRRVGRAPPSSACALVVASARMIYTARLPLTDPEGGLRSTFFLPRGLF